MKVIDAFAGLGGFSLAADALGWDTVAFVEWDKDCQFWLGEHWPGVPIYGDITTVRWEDAPRCDIFTAGFPCQPHSVAGKREASADDRDLWSECVRAISTLRPRYAVLENVPGLLTSESGRFFNRVLSDLAALGYVGRYDVLSAAECGAPHRRERVWIVAYPRHEERSGRSGEAEGQLRGARDQSASRGGRLDNADRGRREQRHASIRCDDVVEPQHDSVGDAELSEGSRLGQLGGNGAATPDRHGQKSPMVRRFALPNWADAIGYRGADGTVRLIPRQAVEEAESRPEPALRALVDGLPDGLAGRAAAEEAEPWPTPRVGIGGVIQEDVDQGDPHKRIEIAAECFVLGGTGGSLWPVTDSEPGRVARLKAVGNAIVPVFALYGPFRYILELEHGKEYADKILRAVREGVCEGHREVFAPPVG